MSEILESIAAQLPAIWIKGAVWSIAAIVAVFVFRFFKIPAAGYRLFWIGNIVALLLIGAIEWTAPDWRINLAPATANLPVSDWIPDLPKEAPLSTELAAPSPAKNQSTQQTAPLAAFTLSPLAIAVTTWALGVFFLAIFLSRNQFRLRKLWRSANDISTAQMTAVEKASKQLGESDLKVSVRRTDQITVPMAWGIFTQKILLPAAIEKSDEKDFQRILLHELSHLESRDPFWSFLSQTALLIHWPNPLVWYAARQLRVSQEKTCDDRVLTSIRGADEAEQYAGLLVSIAKFSTTSSIKSDDSIAFSITGRTSTLSRRIDSILDENMKRTPPTRFATLSAFSLQVFLAAVLGLTFFGDSLTAAERKENEALKKRISELESEVTELKSETKKVVEQAKIDELVEENKEKARERMREDLGEYSQEELREIESLYQVANSNWRTEEARTSLEKLVDEYDEANRTGCALLYLAQYSEGEKREEYLRRVVEDFSDCYYGNGCQVGGYGRYLLAAHLKESGKESEAAKVIEEIEKDYDTATSHSRKLIVEMAQSLK